MTNPTPSFAEKRKAAAQAAAERATKTALLREKARVLKELSVSLGYPAVPGLRLPVPMLRTALFASASKGPRGFYAQEEILPSNTSDYVAYTGEELRQDDADIYLHLINHCEDSGEINFKPFHLFDVIGWDRSQFSVRKLKVVLERLRVGRVSLHFASKGLTAHAGLISKWVESTRKSRNPDGDFWSVTIDPQVLAFIRYEHATPYGVQDVLVRRQLRSSLAKWLLGFFATHLNGQLFTADQLYYLAAPGLDKENPNFERNWRLALRDAGKELVASGLFSEFAVTNKGVIEYQLSSKKNG